LGPGTWDLVLALSEQPEYKYEDKNGRDDAAAEFVCRRSRQTASQKIIHYIPPLFLMSE